MAYDYSKWGLARGASFDRTAAFPLDQQCYFESLANAIASANSAREAGNTTTTYYFGQTVTVVENDIVTNYKIVKSPVYRLVTFTTDVKSYSWEITGVTSDSGIYTISYRENGESKSVQAIDGQLVVDDKVIFSGIQSTDITTWTAGQGVTSTEVTIHGELVSLEQAGEVGAKVLEQAKAYTNASINALDVSEIKESNKFIRAISQTDGKISATAEAIAVSDLPTVPVTKLGLGPNGEKISAQLLPSYVDDVVELKTCSATAPSNPVVDDKYYNTTSKKIFTCVQAGSWPEQGETPEKDKIYVATDTNITYRWGGSDLVMIATALALGETENTAYRGDRGKTAYDHATETKSGAVSDSKLYKITVTAQGHIASTTAATENDIVTLLGTSLSSKADKVTNATAGNVAKLDANGNLVDTGFAATNVVLTDDARLDNASKRTSDTDQGTISKGELAKVTGGSDVTGSIAEAKAAADAAQSDVDALETKVGDIPSTATATTVTGYAKEVADSAESAAKAEAEKKMQYLGVTSTTITAGSTNPVVKINNVDVTATKGQVVTYTTGTIDDEYFWDGAKWKLLSDHNSVASLTSSVSTLQSGKVDKTQKIAGIDLADDITAAELKTALSLGDLAYKSEVAETDLATTLATKINGKVDQSDYNTHVASIATTSALGHVKASTQTDQINVDSSTGVMSVNSITVDHLVDGSEVFILDGGDSTDGTISVRSTNSTARRISTKSISVK